jgi:hypothetical protein
MRGGEFWGARRPAQFRSPTHAAHPQEQQHVVRHSREWFERFASASATDLEIDGLDTKFKLVKLSAKAGEQLIELQEQVKAGKISPVAVAGFTLQHAVATPEGDLLSDEDAAIS